MNKNRLEAAIDAGFAGQPLHRAESLRPVPRPACPGCEQRKARSRTLARHHISAGGAQVKVQLLDSGNWHNEAEYDPDRALAALERVDFRLLRIGREPLQVEGGHDARISLVLQL